MTAAAEDSKKKILIIRREFDAPVELVWQAWTDPQHVMRWWGPHHFTSPSCQMDFREGGEALVCMRSPDGQDFYSTWTYSRIVPMQRIEFTQSLADADGRKLDPATLGLPADFPQDTRTVLTFEALGDKTQFSITEYDQPDGTSKQ